MFEFMDTDGDTQVSKEEFIKMIECPHCVDVMESLQIDVMALVEQAIVFAMNNKYIKYTKYTKYIKNI